jgi:hypothetical protein
MGQIWWHANIETKFSVHLYRPSEFTLYRASCSFISFAILQYTIHNTQYYNKNMNNIHNHRQAGWPQQREPIIYCGPELGHTNRAFFNYITGGAPHGAPPTQPFCPPPSQSPFSLKYKQNMEFRREVWHSSNWNLLCESYVLSFIFNAKHCVVPYYTIIITIPY